jgi:hypothetical protein
VACTLVYVLLLGANVMILNCFAKIAGLSTMYIMYLYQPVPEVPRFTK